MVGWRENEEESNNKTKIKRGERREVRRRGGGKEGWKKGSTKIKHSIITYINTNHIYKML